MLLIIASFPEPLCIIIDFSSFPEQLCIIIDFSSFPEHNIAAPYHVVNFTLRFADVPRYFRKVY